MHRRTFIQSLLASAAAAALPRAGAATGATGAPPWDVLRTQVGGRLLDIHSPLSRCAEAGGAGATELFARIKNPYYLSDEPGLTQTLGWTDAWTFRPSSHAVAAEHASDVAAAVKFARRHRIRLVTKGGGHSYFGNSNAADSLLVWTRRMEAIDLHDDYRCAGAPAGQGDGPAVSVGAGCLWGRVYKKVMVDGGRYVQGGGCLTVGVAGFTMGGGFGSLSKEFGTGAGNLLEAEVVTADGRTRVVNRFQDPDLFFALRGGGGGTFGIVTRLTMKTHPLPATMGAVLMTVTARDEAAWRALVQRMLDLYADRLFNAHWGEQMHFSPGYRLDITMLCHGLGEADMRAAWKPLTDWLDANADAYRHASPPVFVTVPGRDFWNPDRLRAIPGVVLQDDRPGAPSDNVFWASNLDETGQVLHAYESLWLSQSLLERGRRAQLADVLVAGSKHWSLSLHTNKGLAGGSGQARRAALETATNPAVVDAFALLICAASGTPAWPGIAGHAPDVAKGRAEAERVRLAVAPVRRLAPDAPTYMSEASYFGPGWQQAYWGGHYPRLLAAKKKYDPDGLLSGHHCVGS